MSNRFSHCQIIKMASRFLTGTAAMIAASSCFALIADTASADIIRELDYSCSAGGFTGTIRVAVNQTSSGTINRIRSVAYKINKGATAAEIKQMFILLTVEPSPVKVSVPEKASRTIIGIT
jgi:hypothetical protein